MREIAHNWISPVRIKVNASQIAVATAGAAQSEDRSAKQKTTFFDSIELKRSRGSAHVARAGGWHRGQRGNGAGASCLKIEGLPTSLQIGVSHDPRNASPRFAD